MSTIKVNSIKNTATNDGGISIDNSGDVQMSGSVKISGQQMPSAGPLSSRNLVHNGAMRIAQRQTSVTGIATASYLCDRWLFSIASLGTWTLTQENDAPDGFTKSFKVTCTTADASPAAGDYAAITQRFEGQNLQHLKFGTSDAESLIVSFWVKSNKTGNASLDILQIDNSAKQFNASYTINAANTWEYKTIGIPADTAGVINDDNGVGLTLAFWLNSGSDYTGGSHSSGWETTVKANRNATNLGVGGAVNDYFQITGVQLELGSVATPFEHRTFGDDLAICQRYFCKSSSQGVFATAGANHLIAGMFNTGIFNAHLANNGYLPTIYYPVTMRDEATTITTVPTNLGGTSNGQITVYDAGAWNAATVTIGASTATGFGGAITGTWAAGAWLTFFAWTADAELVS
jgi:hypothetical protein